MLLKNARQQVVSSYPYLQNNEDFNSELQDAFSKFVNQGTARDADYNNVWAETVAPVVAKWEARGAALPKLETAKGWQGISDGKSPTEVAKENPLWLTSTSAQTLMREKAISKIKADAAGPKLTPQDSIKLHALGTALTKAINDSDPDAQAKIEGLIDNFKPSLTAPPMATNTPAISPSTGTAGAPATPPVYPGVAAPMGTSGYVDYSVPPSLRPQGHIYMGPKISPEAVAQLFASQGAVPATAPGPSAPPAAATPPPTAGMSLGPPPLMGPPQSRPTPAAPGFKTADDVKAAYKAGAIDKATALKLLQNQFGYAG